MEFPEAEPTYAPKLQLLALKSAAQPHMFEQEYVALPSRAPCHQRGPEWIEISKKKEIPPAPFGLKKPEDQNHTRLEEAEFVE